MRSLTAQPNPTDYAIPTPTFKEVPEIDPPDFDRKTSMIRYNGALAKTLASQ
jgi:hypothetical protein